MNESFSVKFYVYAHPSYPKNCKIYIRITCNRKKVDFSSGIAIDPKDWVEEKQKTNNKRINEELIFIENRIYEVKRQLTFNNLPVSAKAIKDYFLGKTETSRGLIEFFEDFISRIEKQPKEYTRGTVSHYQTTLKHLKAFCDSKKKAPILLSQIDYKFINDFDFYLMTTNLPILNRPMERNTANKQHSRLKSVLLKGMREGLVEKNPYGEFSLKYTKTKRTFLTEEELEKINSSTLCDNPSLQRVRDIFMFSVYTGLRYSDAMDLKMSHIKKDKDGKYWVEKDQLKTDEKLYTPLLQNALDIIKKYDNAERKITGRILPKISNQKINTYLKAIAEIVGLEKELSHHVARHTFATTITLSNDVPIEVVSKLLGHTDIKTTQIYAKITQNYMGKIADKLDKKLKRKKGKGEV